MLFPYWITNLLGGILFFLIIIRENISSRSLGEKERVEYVTTPKI
jgi:hypothetical protein